MLCVYTLILGVIQYTLSRFRLFIRFRFPFSPFICSNSQSFSFIITDHSVASHTWWLFCFFFIFSLRLLPRFVCFFLLASKCIFDRPQIFAGPRTRQKRPGHSWKGDECCECCMCLGGKIQEGSRQLIFAPSSVRLSFFSKHPFPRDWWLVTQLFPCHQAHTHSHIAKSSCNSANDLCNGFLCANFVQGINLSVQLTQRRRRRRRRRRGNVTWHGYCLLLFLFGVSKAVFTRVSLDSLSNEKATRKHVK